MKKVKSTVQEVFDSKDIVHRDQYREYLRNVIEQSTMSNTFLVASVIYKEFTCNIKKIEKVLRGRSLAQYYRDVSYVAIENSFREAVGCSEEIHRQLCLHYESVCASVNKKRHLGIIEQWSSIHLRLWAIGIDRNML